MASVTRNIGLSLGADICWPICYEDIVAKLDLTVPIDGDRIRFEVERVSIERTGNRKTRNLRLPKPRPYHRPSRRGLLWAPAVATTERSSSNGEYRVGAQPNTNKQPITFRGKDRLEAKRRAMDYWYRHPRQQGLSLRQFLQTFQCFYPVLALPGAMERLAHEALEDARDDGIVHVELRFCPALQAGEREYHAAFREFVSIGSSRAVLQTDTIESIKSSWHELQMAESALLAALQDYPENTYLNHKLLDLRAQQLGFMQQLAMLDQYSRRII